MLRELFSTPSSVGPDAGKDGASRRGGSRRSRHSSRLRPAVEVLENLTLLSHLFTVNTLLDTVDSDPRTTSLREAIQQADDIPGRDLIRFDLPTGSKVSLTQGRALTITESVVIQGPGSSALTIGSDGRSGIFENRAPDTMEKSGLVSISGLTLTGGNAAGGGGAIYNASGTLLDLSDAVIDRNSSATSGGGVYNAGGTARLTNCVLSGNAAAGGGGLASDYGGAVSLTLCDVNGNTSRSIGGGVLVVSGTATLTNSTLRNNSVAGSTYTGGGGLFNAGTATLAGCTLDHNTVSGPHASGGGILNNNIATLTNCTLANNSVGGGPDASGGGLWNNGTATVKHCTVAFNAAPVAAGLLNEGSLRMDNTIVARNYGLGDLFNVNGGRISGTNNLLWNNYFGIPAGLAYTVVADPKLATTEPVWNLGYTTTIALGAGSGAINSGQFSGVTTDQRGLPRGPRVDIGAYEADPS